GINPVEPQIGQIELIHKYVDHTDRIVFANPIFKAFGEQCVLLAVRSLNKALHLIPPQNRAGIITRKSLPSTRFYTTKPHTRLPALCVPGVSYEAAARERYLQDFARGRQLRRKRPVIGGSVSLHAAGGSWVGPYLLPKSPPGHPA